MDNEQIISYQPKMKRTMEVVNEIFAEYDSKGIEVPHIYELKNQIEQLSKELKLSNRLLNEQLLTNIKLKEKINETDSDR